MKIRTEVEISDKTTLSVEHNQDADGLDKKFATLRFTQYNEDHEATTLEARMTRAQLSELSLALEQLQEVFSH
jgi:hypothetical protein